MIGAFGGDEQPPLRRLTETVEAETATVDIEIDLPIDDKVIAQDRQGIA